MPPVDVNALAAAVPLDFHDPMSPVVEDDLGLADARPQSAPRPSGRHRVALFAHPRDGLQVHPHFLYLILGQPRRRQSLQHPALLLQALAPPPVASAHDLRNEVLVVLHAAELPAPAQHQPLGDGNHQMVVRALDIPVSVGFTHCDQSGPHPIVGQQGEISRVIPPARPAAPKLVRRRQLLSLDRSAELLQVPTLHFAARS